MKKRGWCEKYLKGDIVKLIRWGNKCVGFLLKGYYKFGSLK